MIGINGKSAFPILNTGYEYQDGTTPTAEEIEQLRQLSWGLSLNRLLTQLNPEIITAYNLPLPKTVAEIQNTQLTGWLGELEAKAKQITVRIDSSSGANGSGIIVAKEGNTYVVLTAEHVICEKDKETNDCIGHTYEIVDPYGNKYPIDTSTINRQEGVDLAVVRFTSTENYPIAQLANYPLKSNDAVFVAGYPKLSNNTPAKWQFSIGYGLERELGLQNVNDNSLTLDKDNSGLIGSQGSLSGGYELVYSSITYGGMSGGAVLDKEGRVIGIHGIAEGETALDSQDSNSKKQVQLGNSLGIPINTFIRLIDRFKITSPLQMQNNRPTEIKASETEALTTAILGTTISQGTAVAFPWLERGNQLWRLRRYEEAVQAFERAIALNPEFIHLAYYGKGLALWDERKYEAALASLEKATEIQSDFVSAFFYKSRLLLKHLNRFDEALVAIEKAISLPQNNANLYNHKGVILSKLKRYSEAETAYKQAIYINPFSGVYSNRGVLYDKQGKVKLALRDYNQGISLNPNNAIVYVNRGQLYHEQGKVELALSDYNQAISLNPNLSIVYNNRGFLYYEQGKVELALSDYNQAISLDSNYANAYYNNQAISLDPNYALAHHNRGVLYYEQGKVELALSDYNQAISLNPNDAIVYYNRGSFYHKQRKVELALSDYNQAISLNPHYAQAYYNRGSLSHRQGKVELALSDYNQAISLDPNYALAYNNLGSLQMDIGYTTIGRSNLQKAQQLFLSQGNTAAAEKVANFLKQLP